MILDLYAGPGGWSEGLRMLGMSDVGIEWDAAACKTRAAAGHRTIRADVTALPATHLRGKVDLLIASPPCTAFSMAGKGAGRDLLDALCRAAYRGDWHALRDEHEMVVWAPLDVGRWIEECQPERIALEQVPPCLPLWEALAHWLRGHGYSAATSVLNAADFGVPQTRQRAFLVASRDGVAELPEPTHARTPVDSFFGTKAKWVSMAEALGWGMTERTMPTLTGGGIATGGPEPIRNRDLLEREIVGYRRMRGLGMNDRHGDRPDTPVTEPAPTLTSKVRSDVWVLDRRTNSRGAGGGDGANGAGPDV